MNTNQLPAIPENPTLSNLNSYEMELVSAQTAVAFACNQQIANINADASVLLRNTNVLRRRIVEEEAERMPAWANAFMSSINQHFIAFNTRMERMETRMERMETRMETMETRMETMETRMETMETRMERMESTLGGIRTSVDELQTEVRRLNYFNSRMRNMELSRLSFPIEVIPFLGGSLPSQDLTVIKSVEDINGLPRGDVITYLTGYGIAFSETESPRHLRAKLRDALGLDGEGDKRFQFHDSWTRGH